MPTINDSLQNNSPKPLDNKYGIFASGAFRAYASVAEANTTIIAAYRSVGQTVLINTSGTNNEYWYQGGIADGNLIAKSPLLNLTTPIYLNSGSIAILQSGSSQNGYLSSTDWTSFNAKIATVSNIGTGNGWYSTTVGVDMRLKSIKPGSGITLTDSGSDITVAAALVHGINVGTGAGIYTTNSGTDIQLRSIKGGTGVTATQNSTEIQLDLTDTTILTPFTSVDATPSVMGSVSIQDNSAGILEVTVIGLLTTDTTTCTMAKRAVKYYKASGVLYLLGVIEDIISESTSGFTSTSWDVVANVSTNNFDIQVTGQASTNIKWSATIKKTFNS